MPHKYTIRESGGGFHDGQWVSPGGSGYRTRERIVFRVERNCFMAAIKAVWPHLEEHEWNFQSDHLSNGERVRVFKFRAERELYTVTRVD